MKIFATPQTLARHLLSDPPTLGLTMSDSDSSSDPDSPPPPSSAECQARVEKFVSVVKGTDEAYAQMLLQRNGWDVERAVDKHFTKEVNATREKSGFFSSLSLSLSVNFVPPTTCMY